MIQITIYKHNNEYSKITAFGHAGFEEYGKDIVCAAVSVLIINTANSLEQFTDDLFDASTLEDGTTEILLKEHPGEKAVLLLDSLCFGLNCILSQYGETYLRIDYKEV